MELNDDLFKANGLHQSIKKAFCPRRGLNRQEAAIYVGVSSSLFDDLVKSGEMPKPLRINRRTRYSREHRGSKGLSKDRAATNLRILPSLGEAEVAKLTSQHIRDWHTGLGAAPKLTRSGRLDVMFAG
jgi:predicted DNA-binding transcriptional regulator AlpA